MSTTELNGDFPNTIRVLPDTTMATKAVADLYDSADPSLWRAALGCYEETVKAVAAQRKKSRTEGLVPLDAWFQKTLPASITSRDTPHLTHEELTKLMKWKLTRGKFRPRLMELVQQNTPSQVEKVTRDAIAALPNMETAVKILTQLKAVGPATASAILCAAAPDQAPFMADESVLAVPELGKLEYNLKHYRAYAKKIQTKAHQLSKLDQQPGDKNWTPHNVELALWSFHFAKKLNPELLITRSSWSSIERNSESEASDSEPPPKKHKPS